MMTTETMAPAEYSDAELVAHSLRGSRDAFGQIVARYQSLICSLAYSSTGSLTQSEDLAQETFLTAWQQLSELREPAKLRAWLCGIVRNLGHRIRRGQAREPLDGAAPLEMLEELPAREAHPLDQAISREEEGILWRSLERIPETYREPLILFYREHRSMAQVALALELSEEAVRQRLARGRKLLHEEVLGFVEGALEKTSPDRQFTLGVLAALPVQAASAKAAAAGASLAKGVTVAKSAATLSSLGSLLALLGGAFVSWRAQADETKSPRERRFFLQMVGVRLVTMLLLVLVYYFGFDKTDLSHAPFARDVLTSAFIFSCCVLGVVLFIFNSHRRQQIQIEEGTFDEAEWNLPRRETDSAAKSPGAKSNRDLTALKFMAFALVVTAIMICQSPWQQHLGQAMIWSAVAVVALFLSFRCWKNRPRYWSLRSGWVVAGPIAFGLMTLLSFDLRQYRAQAGSVIVSAAPPAEVIAFNVVVALAYALFAGILVWKRQGELRASR
jgi:RNA polymerase sigma factor (sigma-70 family)